MGTKVQCATYLPGFYTMRDLNEDADGNSSNYYDNKTSDRNLYNGYKLSPLKGYLEYEIIRRRMIEQEAIFRRQVFELHRLYRVQKGLMAELFKGPYHYLLADTSQSNSFSSQNPSEGTNRILQMTPPLNLLDEKGMQSGPISTGKESTLEDGGCKEFPRKMFDFKLPADAYIDCEEIERLEEEIAFESSSLSESPLNIIQGAQVESDVKLTLETGEGSQDLCIQSGQISANFLGTRSFKENKGLQLPMRSKTNAFFGGRHYDEGTSSHHFHVDEEETTRQLSFFNNQSGQSSMKVFSPASSTEKFSMPAENILLNQKPREILSLDQKKRDAWFKPKTEISAINPQYDMFMDFYMKNTCPVSPLHSSFSVPANTNSHLPLNYGNQSATWLQSNGELGSSLRVGKNPNSYDNGFNQGYRFDYSPNFIRTSDGHTEGYGSQRPQKGLNLNHKLPNGFQDSIHRRNQTCNTSSMMELDFSQGYPQLKPACGLMNLSYGAKQETEKNLNFFNLKDLPSSSQVKERQSSNKFFGIPISELIQPSEKEKQKYSILETQISLHDLVTKSTNRIDLNFDLNLFAENEFSEPIIALKIDLGGNPDETLITEAAKSVLLLSSEVVNTQPVQNPSFDALHWLAEEVISSSAEGMKETLNDMIDEFEQMTLQLEETKPEEYWYWCQPKGVIVQKNEEDVEDNGKSNFASLLFTKPRRGQARKRRQKRNFQRDILPGLALLSRQEVNEDIQTLGALMKASGESWPARMTRRNGGRNGSGSRGRGGRRARSLAVTAEEVKETPTIPPMPEVEVTPSSNTNEGEVDGKSMLGWGRTTRRCRRQRFSSVANVAAPLT